MKNLLFFLVSMCNFSNSQVPQHTMVWKHVNAIGKDSFELYSVSNNKTKIPYLNEELNYLFLDSLIESGIVYDSMLNEYAAKKVLDIPTPVIGRTKIFVTA